MEEKTQMKKYVYMFPEGNGKMRELLGGKGANLAEMTGLGMPVPQGFTITTEACTRYYEDGKTIYPDIQDQILEYLDKLEKVTGKTLGDPEKPLLVSVRSGARASMPGMMDTILNLGMNDEICDAVAKLTNNPRFARDSYRRFIQMFSDVVMELPKSTFETFIDQVKEKKGVKLDNELDADDMSELIVLFKDHYKKSLGEDFPQDPKKQLMEAVRAVFRSWDNPRANTYRRMNDIPHSWGTAVNVQSMVFGNMGDTSGTGVAFTRNPATGEKKLYGEFLMNAQGEDVVAGIRTPQPISALADTMPEVYQQFVDISSRLEQHYGDMQDMEFTIENGKLYMLQTRNGKRTAQAALKVAVDLVDEGVCTKEQAIMKVEPKQLDALLHPTFVPAALEGSHPDHHRPAGVSRRCLRRSLLHRGRGRSRSQDRREGRSGASGDFAGGYRRHGGFRRHHDRPRRHDLARSGCCARHGHLLRRWRQRHQGFRREQDPDLCRRHRGQGRRIHLARRLDR